jgi:RNA polymerase sigma-70 factor (ECF subfamily)
MWKQTTPEPDSDARRGASMGARTQPACNVGHPASGGGKVGVTPRDGLSDEVNLNDAWLVEHARHGDHQAFAVLVRRYERKLIRVLTRLVREPEQARDLAQETFWRVYARLDRFDTARRFGPWLFRVGVNLGLDWLRSSKSEPLLGASIDRTGNDGQSRLELPDPDPRIEAELAQEVQFVLALMPVSYRTILVLRDLEGFSSSEVAAIVGRREATVRWRLSKARERFREIWDRRQNDPRGAAKGDKTRYGQADG